MDDGDYDDAVKIAAGWIEQECANRGTPGVLVTSVVNAARYTPTLQWFKDRHRNHITPKGRNRQNAPRNSPTLVYVPDEEMLELAGSFARGAALCAVESRSFPLGGWAAALGAVNLDTGEAAPEPAEEVAKVLDRIVWMGNNAYGDKYAKTSVGHALDDLRAIAPEVDGAFLAGWVIAKGRSERAATAIRKLVDGNR